ncbi:MAG TPA: hypothetical protein VK387_04465 [Thermoleophilaceae bacterium]|nr:hypothetical protein [Thermoleophilaceae bacterium]
MNACVANGTNRRRLAIAVLTAILTLVAPAASVAATYTVTKEADTPTARAT